MIFETLLQHKVVSLMLPEPKPCPATKDRWKWLLLSTIDKLNGTHWGKAKVEDCQVHVASRLLIYKFLILAQRIE